MTAPLEALTRAINGEPKPPRVPDSLDDWVLPDGVVETFNYRLDRFEYEAECRGCGEYKPILCDIEEVPLEGYEHWCGGSPRCCP